MKNNSFFLGRINHALSCGVFLILFINTSKAHIFPGKEKFLALHAFGDSLFDTGNNNALKGTLLRANFPPNGKDFKHKKATGRFSNGKLIPDFLAEAMGLKELLPPYMELARLKSKDFKTGVCFASAGSGFDPLTSKILQVYSMQDQLKFFDDYLVKLKSQVGKRSSRRIIDKSLFMISSGGNDIMVTYYGSKARQVQYNIASYTDLLVKNATNFLKDLYQRGARKIGVLTVGPLGCTPFANSLSFKFGSDGCVEEMNKAARLFNHKLKCAIASLNKKLPGCKIILADTYTPASTKNPDDYGFHVINKGCCSSGLLETGVLCNNFSKVCSNISEYVFWDSIHPTERAYKFSTEDIIKDLVF